MESVHQVYFIERKHPKGYVSSGERLTQHQTTTRPDHVWPEEVWTKIGKSTQNPEKHEWAKEKPKLDNARRLGGIYFVDVDDQDYKDTCKKTRGENWKDLWQPSCSEKEMIQMGSRMCLHNQTASEQTPTTICGCIVEAHESTRQQVESSQTKNHEDHIAGKGFNSRTQLQFGAHIFLCHKR